MRVGLIPLVASLQSADMMQSLKMKEKEPTAAGSRHTAIYPALPKGSWVRVSGGGWEGVVEKDGSDTGIKASSSRKGMYMGPGGKD